MAARPMACVPPVLADSVVPVQLSETQPPLRVGNRR